jgi:hypothetical protein
VFRLSAIEGSAMSLAQWTEPKPCALSQPRFVKIRVRDERGVPTGETYTKRISRPSCASGDAAVWSCTVNGTTYHLCSSCSRADLVAVVDPAPYVPPTATEPACPDRWMEDETTMAVRVCAETRKLRRALTRAGWTAKPRTRTIRRAGFLTATVSLWVRPV